MNGGVISWRSKNQSCVALSSTEAELKAFTEATKEAIWIKKLLNEIGQMSNEPITIYEDNQSCQKLFQNSNSSNRTKHIEIRYQFIKDYIQKGVISCKYCPSDNMIADMLTKPLNKVKFEKFRNLSGIQA